MSSYTTTYNRKKDILILRKGPTQGLEHTLLSAEKIYSIFFFFFFSINMKLHIKQKIQYVQLPI